MGMIQQIIKMKHTSFTSVALHPEMPTVDSPFPPLLELSVRMQAHVPYTYTRHMEASRRPVSQHPALFP